jgi:hypothetical protein
MPRTGNGHDEDKVEYGTHAAGFRAAQRNEQVIANPPRQNVGSAIRAALLAIAILNIYPSTINSIPRAMRSDDGR